MSQVQFLSYPKGFIVLPVFSLHFLKAMVYKIGWFLNLILPKWVAGITLAPFGIYLRKDVLYNYRINNHESIHWRQQWEMLIIFFYLWYSIEWFTKLFKYGKQAYSNVSFEREAKHGEMLDYYEIERKSYAWVKFIVKKEAQ